jgi:hypothetical protein
VESPVPPEIEEAFPMSKVARVEIRSVERGFFVRVEVEGQELRERVFERAESLLEWLSGLLLDREPSTDLTPEDLDVKGLF